MSARDIKLSDILDFSEKQKLATKTADEFDFILYGGAGGGGKSFWLRWYSIRWLILMWKKTGQLNIRGGLFCEDYPSLKDRHVTKMKTEFPEWLGTLKEDAVYGLSFRIADKLGGGILSLRNLDDPSKYFSSEFALIAVDELTRNPKETFDFLRFRKRWPGIAKTKFIAGTNPGGIGHDWVKKKWVLGQHDPNEKEGEQFKYIPARVYDNPHVDPNYIKALESLPDRLRKAYLDGDWDIFEGQYFSEFSQERHVVVPFKIPDTWFKYRSIDVSGRSGITSCHWYAIDPDGRVWVYKEWYGTGLDSDEHARKIAEMSEGEEYRYTVMDSAAWSKMGLPETTAEIYIRNGVQGLVESSKNRVMGWDIVHSYLRWSETEKPKLLIFKNCVNMIRTIPNLIHDENHPEDVDSSGEDHAADELRYFLQTLRITQSPKPMSIVERRIREIKEIEELQSYNYSYRKII